MDTFKYEPTQKILEEFIFEIIKFGLRHNFTNNIDLNFDKIDFSFINYEFDDYLEKSSIG
jgi:hypothetical protein